MLFHFDLKEFQEKVSTQFRPWQRSFQFWVRAADIYTGYKVTPFASFTLYWFIHNKNCL